MSDSPPEERGERIAKFLARAGVASRRDIEKLIADGVVKVNNTKVIHPATFVTEGDLITVAGKLVEPPARTRRMLPSGTVATATVMSTNCAPGRF